MSRDWSSFNADAHTMVRFSPELWALMAVIAGACVLAFLHHVAAAIDHERRMLNLRLEAEELRRRYARQLRGEDDSGSGLRKAA